MRDTETEFERDPGVMAEKFEHKYVAMVASIIGIVILLLGFAGILVNLFVT